MAAPPRPPPGFRDEADVSALRPPIVPRELRHLSRETPPASVSKPEEPASQRVEAAATEERGDVADRTTTSASRWAVAALAIAGAIGVALGFGSTPNRAAGYDAARRAPTPLVFRTTTLALAEPSAKRPLPKK
jgi:hypothetical protein